MESFQVTVLKGIQSFLEDVDGFIAEHPLALVVGLMAFLAVVGLGLIIVGSCRKSVPRTFIHRDSTPYFIDVKVPPPPPEEEFHVFPLPHQIRQRDRDPDDWKD